MTVTAPPATIAGATAVVPYRDLLAALTTVGTVLDRKSRPPWNAALITADLDGRLTVTGASPAATVSVRLPGAARSAGQFLVDGWALTQMCKALVRGEHRRDTDELPVLLDGSFPPAPTVTIGDYTVPLTGLPVEDHPGACRPAPTIATVDRAAWRAAVDRVLPAVGRDDTLRVLTGLYVSFAPGLATVAGTDRYRLAVDVLPATVTGPAVQELLLPAKILAACAETWTGPSVTIGRRRAESVHDVDRVTFTCGQTTVSLVETGGAYPPWRRLLGSLDPQHTATFDRATVAAHVARVLAILTAHPTTRRPIMTMTLTLTPDGLRVAPLLPEHGARVSAPTLPATTSLTDGTVRWAFNAAYLRAALAALPGDTVLFSGQADVAKPVLLTSPEQGASIPPYRHLLMPICID
ncbi:DNA polymerase III beta subunit family protein [Frankia casuarinae]|uniref:DNA polymerase III beta subunit family protein n=1 Tax=Frankia casuarinae (strain DSM 45818 / CECT 9043 / HFP020203 / CcI3) TaxID=106370 RepID=Q2JCA6_FRACC|nr:DNA polymerase III subunit beta [Frankia casuarinae]ABD11086.1 DNA polymerase III beta subunit family protein [Frankia casuarinae]EYT90681.1 DNA polymerase III beta subunit family protein [Frankia casuarinae]